MIDWHYVVANGLWILGAAVSVASLSYHDWISRLDGRPLRRQLSSPSFLATHHASMALVAIGLSLRPGEPSWLKVLCITLAAASLGALVSCLRSLRRS